MPEISFITTFGSLAAILIHLFQLKPPARNFLLLICSLLFFYYVCDSKVLLALLGAWVFVIYGTARWLLKNQSDPTRSKRVFRIYVLIVIGLFIALKSGLIDPQGRIPVGFSFLMFLSIGLLIDIVDGKLRSLPRFRDFSLACIFFPTAPVGPFMKLQTAIASSDDPPDDWRAFEGYCRFCLGLFKFAVSETILDLNYFPGLEIVGPVKYPLTLIVTSSLYLYLNFSGYSDLVVGMAALLGVRTPINFRFPFLSNSPADYWRKWHISLGGWFREFVFFPMNYGITHRKPRINESLAAALSTFLTFLLIGLWHGVTPKFLTWSVLNAFLVAFLFPRNTNRWLGIPLTLLAMTFVNALFLSRDLRSFSAFLASLARSDWSALLKHQFLAPALLFLTVSILIISNEHFLDLLARKQENQPRLRFLNLLFSVITLFFGITVGVGHTHAIYIGY